MLSLLALVAFQNPGDAPFPHATLSQVADALDSLGYALDLNNPIGSSGKLTHEGATVEAWFSVPSTPQREVPPLPIRAFQVSIELAFPDEIPLDPAVEPSAPVDPKKPIRFVPHLGKTVSVSTLIDLKNDTTQGQVRALLERFWRETATYANVHGGRFAAAPIIDWSKVRFSDDYVLKAADKRSLERATSSWGWQYRKGWGGSTAGWVFPIDVDGVECDVKQGFRLGEGFLPNTFFNVGSYIDLPEGADIDRWVATEGKRIRWAEVSTLGGPQRVFLDVVFDLRKGVPLGELRRRIKAFAVELGTFRRSMASYPPQRSVTSIPSIPRAVLDSASRGPRIT